MVGYVIPLDDYTVLTQTPDTGTGNNALSFCLVTPPAVEPLTLAEAKTYLRVDTTDDDALIGALIVSARMMVEQRTQRVLITQGWRMVMDRFADPFFITVTVSPFQTLQALKVYNKDGTFTLIDPSQYLVDTNSTFARVCLLNGLAQPTQAIMGITLDFTAGYGNTSANVPEPLRQAMRELIYQWYDNRGDILQGSEANHFPAIVQTLLEPYCVVRL